MIHDLKCWPEYFKAVKSGIKPFEYRKDDRGYAVGDILHLREYDPATFQYSGDEIDKTVTCILPVVTYGAGNDERYVIMGLAPRPDWTPCAEGMPEDLPEFQPMSRYECTILIPDGTREVFALHRTGNGRWLYETGKGLDAVHGDQVVAWRKVSAPYDPDRKEDAKSDDVSQWPDWKKRAALSNYELGKED